MTNHVVLFEPEIPENTGNIARTCAGTDTVLHLIEPLGFKLNDKSMKRSGLDYWDHVKLIKHDSLQDFLETLPEDAEMYLISKFSSIKHTDPDYTDPNKDYYFVFGKETTGLPETFMRQHFDHNLRIPMSDNIRSFNLANSVAIVLFEALRQQDFPHMETSHHYENDKLKDDYNRPGRYHRNI
ncbi:MAG: tRNA (uridine(34)/cytosine(34)/5-carboxymethylaminomethyluridine(34)-2'-O)-methyltransferase TrmL [Lactobacillus sp.]|nr:tRNA (uridine(34)/cytosine(34)/5-carboxymethylaminomethyluridine(34)-2'-O)-methyltransferase TrmL [Lactobacillus sp.]